MDIAPPSVENKVIDKARGVTYRVLAYRALSATELRMAVAAYHSPKRKALKHGAVVTIVTVLGL